MASVEDEIRQANARFTQSVARGDPAGIVACYTEDAEFIAPSQPISSGKSAVLERMKGMLTRVTELELRTREVASDGDLAWETGKSVAKDRDGAVLAENNYVVVWKRVSGAWLIHRDIVTPA